MAKADLRKAELPTAASRLIGAVIDRARRLRGWSLKEFAAAVNRNERQVARWIDGSERAQMDLLFAIDGFRHLLVIAFAEVAGPGVDVVTEIRVRRAEVA